jgi:hypothetical protein
MVHDPNPQMVVRGISTGADELACTCKNRQKLPVSIRLPGGKKVGWPVNWLHSTKVMIRLLRKKNTPKPVKIRWKLLISSSHLHFGHGLILPEAEWIVSHKFI